MNKNVEEYIKFRAGEIRMPEHLKPKKELKGQIYKSDFMERITRTPIWVPQIMWLVIISLFFWYVITRTTLSIEQIALLGLSGFITWTLMEYLVHRFLYHTETNSKAFLKIQFSGHGIHHQHPKDPERLAMPPLPGIVLASVFFGIFWLIMKTPSVFAFFPGFMLGYLCYITMHYYQHVVKSPKYKPWKKLWAHHKAHHYSNPYVAYGVSTRLWDWLFNTMPKKGAKEIHARKTSLQ